MLWCILMARWCLWRIITLTAVATRNLLPDGLGGTEGFVDPEVDVCCGLSSASGQAIISYSVTCPVYNSTRCSSQSICTMPHRNLLSLISVHKQVFQTKIFTCTAYEMERLLTYQTFSAVIAWCFTRVCYCMLWLTQDLWIRGHWNILHVKDQILNVLVLGTRSNGMASFSHLWCSKSLKRGIS